MKRTHAYTVRLNDEEKSVIDSAAAEKALDVASWIRMVSFEAARQQTGSKR